MQSETLIYYDDSNALEAFIAYPSNKSKEKIPVVILCHAWKGRDEFIFSRARGLAQEGYIAFALDMYGKGVLGKTREENAALKMPFMKDRAMLQKRVLKGYETAKTLPQVDIERIAVLGYGFGGVCSLDLARSGVDLKGAISIYGHFDPPPSNLIKPIKAKILILHGSEDPVSTREDLQKFEDELDVAKVDWQAHIYGGTMHAFASPDANDPKAGINYNPISAARSWSDSKIFLNEIFASINNL